MDFGLISIAEWNALAQVIFVDLVLAGDNAIVVGLVAAGLPVDQRRRVIVIGIAAATIMRVLFAILTVQLLQVVGLMLAGGLLLLWVCWKLWRETRELQRVAQDAREASVDDSTATPKRKTLLKASMQIVIADLSMSLDNVLAVAGIAREHTWVLIVGLVLSVVFMGVAASFIARLLERRPWIAYLGLVVILYVAVRMIVDGTNELMVLV
ncbi:MAG: YjbE family integral membrane protein [Gammaproteobacteria bacterium]